MNKKPNIDFIFEIDNASTKRKKSYSDYYYVLMDKFEELPKDHIACENEKVFKEQAKNSLKKVMYKNRMNPHRISIETGLTIEQINSVLLKVIKSD